MRQKTLMQYSLIAYNLVLLQAMAAKSQRKSQGRTPLWAPCPGPLSFEPHFLRISKKRSRRPQMSYFSLKIWWRAKKGHHVRRCRIFHSKSRVERKNVFVLRWRFVWPKSMSTFLFSGPQNMTGPGALYPPAPSS